MPPTPDGGPIYTETNFNHFVKEPYNMGSSLLFFFLALYWLWRLWGPKSSAALRRKQWLLAAASPILLIGAIGGTIFHGFRISRIFLVMDFMPILILLIFAASVLWGRLLGRWYYVLLVLIPFIILELAVFRILAPYTGRMFAINISYSVLAFTALVPILGTLWQQHWRYTGLVALALGSFVLAVLSRAADTITPPLLPMGTHFLWHTFGVLAAGLTMYWLYRLFEESPISAQSAKPFSARPTLGTAN